MIRGAAAAAVAALGALGAWPAAAAERFDHRGAVSAFLAPGIGSTVSSQFIQEPGARWALLAGAGAAFDVDGNELVLFGRASGNRAAWDASLWGGYRGYFGDERVRTFLDLQLGGSLFPALTLGPRIGGGVQYEVASVAGLYGGLGVALGFGGAFQMMVDVVIGLQLRTYWLE